MNEFLFGLITLDCFLSHPPSITTRCNARLQQELTSPPATFSPSRRPNATWFSVKEPALCQ